MSRWIAPVASLALLAGLGGMSARAANDAGAMPVGKATITVKIVDADGKAVPDVKVGLYAPRQKKAEPASTVGTHAQPLATDDAPPATPPADNPKPKRQRPKPIQTTTTDAQGEATFKDVADGSYYVQAHLKGTGNGREKVTVTDGKDVTVSVTLKPRA